MSRILAVFHEMPYPARHGGAIDVWSRLEAMRDLGHEVMLACWHRPVESPEVLRAAWAARSGELVLLLRRARLRALLSGRPPQMVSLGKTGDVLRRLEPAARAFAPDWIQVETWPSAGVAMQLGERLERPVVYRSQNAERQYWRELVAASSPPRSWRLALTGRRVGRVEAEVRSRALMVLDIAMEDAGQCARDGCLGCSVLLPPTWRGTVRIAGAEPVWDVLFGGNLWAPTNVEGVLWLVREVVPMLRQKRPGLRVAVAGARPAATLLRVCRAAGVEVLAGPEDMAAILPRARVLVNPARRSSGVNMKMLDMLAAGPPIVSTQAGVRGLPEAARSFVAVVDSASAVVDAVLDRLASPQSTPEQRRVLLEEAFGVGRLAAVLDDIATRCGRA